MKGKIRANKLHTAARVKMLEHEINAAWSEKDLDKSLDLLASVLKLNPRSISTRLLIGRVHGVRYEYDHALDWFDQAVEMAPQHERGDTLIRAGKMARLFFDPSVAETLLEDAVAESPALPAKLALAEHLIRIRKIEQARVLVDEVLGASIKSPEATFLWCRLNEDYFAECEARLMDLMSSESGELKAKVGYQLAKMRDQAGDYDGAMSALVAAKDVLLPARDLIVQNRANVHARQREIAVGLSSAQHKSWQTQAAELGAPARLALLGGHPRSGTTLLEQILDSHPDIVSAEESENFDMFAFSPLVRMHPPSCPLLDVMESCSVGDLVTSRRSYLDAMDRCIGEQVGDRLLVDKNPSLTSLVPAFCRIFPETKFIAMIRDPRDVVISCYMQSFVPVSSVNGNYLTLKDTAHEYRQVMGAWIEVAGKLEIDKIEIRYEDMVEDLEAHARKALGFLGVDWNESVMEYDRHAREKVVRSPTSVAVTEKVHKRAKARWKNYEKHLEPVFETLSPCLKALGYE
jgi:hypothetical protein